VSKAVGDFLRNASEGIGNFCKQQILMRGLPIPYIYVPKGIAYPVEQFQIALFHICGLFKRIATSHRFSTSEKL
jgi:hypothetical protein